MTSAIVELPVLGRSQWYTKANLRFVSPSQFVASSWVRHLVVMLVIDRHIQWRRILEYVMLFTDVYVRKVETRVEKKRTEYGG
jgi:hypothetical protein